MRSFKRANQSIKWYGDCFEANHLKYLAYLIECNWTAIVQNLFRFREFAIGNWCVESGTKKSYIFFTSFRLLLKIYKNLWFLKQPQGSVTFNQPASFNLVFFYMKNQHVIINLIPIFYVLKKNEKKNENCQFIFVIIILSARNPALMVICLIFLLYSVIVSLFYSIFKVNLVNYFHDLWKSI